MLNSNFLSPLAMAQRHVLRETSLNLFLAKLTSQTRLTLEERQAVESLGGRIERLDAHTTFVELGESANAVCLVIDGVCARVHIAVEDRRQITALYITGDMPDFYSVFQPEPNATMETMTVTHILKISHTHIREVMRRFPALTEAFARYVICDAAIMTEWLANVGARQAKAALAHLFCEMAVRLDKVEGEQFSYDFAVSQTQLADVTGLSVVHVNRSLMALRSAKLMSMKQGRVWVLDWRGLTDVAGFDASYLMPGPQMRFADE